MPCTSPEPWLMLHPCCCGGWPRVNLLRGCETPWPPSSATLRRSLPPGATTIVLGSVDLPFSPSIAGSPSREITAMLLATETLAPVSAGSLLLLRIV